MSEITVANAQTVAAIAPHGGQLIHRIAASEEEMHLRGKAPYLRSIRLSARQMCDLKLLGNGAFSPLEGFMSRADYLRVVREMHLANGLPWTIPVTLAVSGAEAPSEGESVALYDSDGVRLAGIMDIHEVYPNDKRREALEVYRTEDEAHPGVRALYAQGDTLLGGAVTVISATADRQPHELSPAETRAAFAASGWRTIVGFQTRNPVHRAHEYIQKCALETVDGLLLHPLVGETKSDDIPADVRMRCYEVLLAHYYPRNRVLLATLPAAMRYAGPREAIFHAIVRKNYGCTHFIVGRDHAGVGNYYGTYEAQQLFEEFSSDELGIRPMKFENSFYCHRCGGMASDKTCPHPVDVHVALSGTAVRNMLRAGELPPPEFSRPEVAQILIDAMRAQD